MSLPLTELLQQQQVPCWPQTLEQCTSNTSAPMVDALVLDSRQIAPLRAVGFERVWFCACAGVAEHGLVHAQAAYMAGAAGVLYEPDTVAEQQLCEQNLPSQWPLVPVVSLGAQLGVLASQLYGAKSAKLQPVAITGTNGKTSCSHLLAQLWAQLAVRPATIGTAGWGVWPDLATASHTTPDVLTVHRLLTEFVDAGAQRLVMEVSSHGLDQGRVAGMHFATAIFTNLSRDHLDYHSDMADYWRCKRQLFSWAGLGRAVVNIDDEHGAELAAAFADTGQPEFNAQCFSYSASGDVQADLYVSQSVPTMSGLNLEVAGRWGVAQWHVPLLGEFNAANILAVATALLAEGIAMAQLTQALGQLQTVVGRMEAFQHKGRPTVVVDYAHTPDAIRQALKGVREHCRGQLWVVFGCGGDRDQGKRPLMGSAAEALADQVILTSDNPRSEDPDAILKGIAAGLANADRAQVIPERAQAIRHAVEHAAVNDLVLVAGKGHEDYQEVAGQRLPFSDRDVVRSLLQEVAA